MDLPALDAGLAEKEAMSLATELLRQLREDQATVCDASLTHRAIEVLRAGCVILEGQDPLRLTDSLGDVEKLFSFIETAPWPEPDFEERRELLGDCAFAGWRLARRAARTHLADTWAHRVEAAESGTDYWGLTSALNAPIANLSESEREALLGDPKALVVILAVLQRRPESSPANTLRDSEFIHGYLNSQVLDSLRFKFDEANYFLGEFARVAGVAARFVSRRGEARTWFDLAEQHFIATSDETASVARVAYQRLALKVEEQESFETVLEEAPILVNTFADLEMPEDALKTRLLEAAAFKELDRLPEAIQAYCSVTADSDRLKNERLRAYGEMNLASIYCFLGETAQAAALAAKVTPVLIKLDSRAMLAKLHWSFGYLHRRTGDLSASTKAFRTAREELRGLGMLAEVAQVHLVTADVLLDAGEEEQAEWEIRQALPIIEEYKLVPEGFAAMTLLRESLRRQKIDRNALRNLHEHFEQKKT